MEVHKIGRVWILGAGVFGCRAVQALLPKAGPEGIWLVDRDYNQLLRCAQEPIQRVAIDFRPFLFNGLRRADPKRQPQWIVPAVSIHVVFEWLRLEIGESRRLRLLDPPREILQQLPHAFKAPDGAVYASFADFICPEDCPEPENHCYTTGDPRPQPLYRLIETLNCRDLRKVVVRSQQLAPGVGGYTPQILYSARKQLENFTGRALIATACRCHGVLHCLEILA
jgi:hypothetical protein